MTFKPFQPSQTALSRLMNFKAAEREDDPERIPHIRGPYEIFYEQKFGGPPPGIWNLRVQESRSGLLWQALSGALDRHEAFASAYVALALDLSLNTDEYRRELQKLNKSWVEYLKRDNLTSDHNHSVIRDTYHRVSCAQCSTLTALAVQDPEIHEMFTKELLPLKNPADRMALLKDKGLITLLDAMIPDKPTKLDL